MRRLILSLKAVVENTSYTALRSKKRENRSRSTGPGIIYVAAHLSLRAQSARWRGIQTTAWKSLHTLTFVRWKHSQIPGAKRTARTKAKAVAQERQVLTISCSNLNNRSNVEGNMSPFHHDKSPETFLSKKQNKTKQRTV